jgi:hypothetical protein
MIEINGINYLEQVKDNVSNLAHLMKGNDSLAISFFANFVLKQNVVDDNSILIPCPQHSGSAIYTLNAANLIASVPELQSSIFLNVLQVIPSTTLNNQNHLILLSLNISFLPLFLRNLGKKYFLWIMS